MSSTTKMRRRSKRDSLPSYMEEEEYDAAFAESLATDGIDPEETEDPTPAPVHPPPVVRYTERPRMSQERLEQRVRIAADHLARCPKRPGTKASRNWAHVVDGMTVSAMLGCPSYEGGRRQARRDLDWALEHGLCYLQDPSEWVAEQREGV